MILSRKFCRAINCSAVQRRIDKMAQKVKDSLCVYLKTFRFPIRLYGSTLPGNGALLSAYVQFTKEEQIGKLILKENQYFMLRKRNTFEKYLISSHMVKLGLYRGFLAFS